MRKKLQCPLLNIRFMGNSIDERHRNSWQECAAWCYSTSDCSFWTWTHDGLIEPSDGICMLKGDGSDFRANDNYMSGDRACLKAPSGKAYRTKYGTASHLRVVL